MTDIKKVSKKKILFVQIDEEITRIFERVEKLPYNEVYLVVPKRAILLQSVVNLKILKQKISEIGKQVSLIANDVNGMKLAYQADYPWRLSMPGIPSFAIRFKCMRLVCLPSFLLVQCISNEKARERDGRTA